MMDRRLEGHSGRETELKGGHDLNFTEIGPIPMKNVGGGPLEPREVIVKVGDDDLGLMTSKSRAKTFSSRDPPRSTRGCKSNAASYSYCF